MYHELRKRGTADVGRSMERARNRRVRARRRRLPVHRRRRADARGDLEPHGRKRRRLRPRRHFGLRVVALVLTDRHQIRVMSQVEGQLTGAFDCVRIERVVQNLLSNAVKYSPDGGEVLISQDPLPITWNTTGSAMTNVQRAPGIPKEKSSTVRPVQGPATIHLPLQVYALPFREASVLSLRYTPVFPDGETEYAAH